MPYNRAMSKRAKVAAELDEETLAGLDRIAADWDVSREHVLATAVLRFVDEELTRLPLDPDDPLAKLPPYVETDPLAIALSEAEDKAREAFDAYMKAGEDAADAGDTISQEEMREWFAQRIAARRSAAAAAE
jgi:predicted transcriptional regulator